jgi:hypothetical protein
MRYFNRQNALLWIVALTAMLFGPKVPSAFAQPESLADWSTKAQAEKPIPSDKKVKFNGLAAVFRSGQFENQGDDQLFANFYEKRIFPYITDPKKRGEREDVVTKLRNDYKALAKFSDSPVRDKLTDITLEYMVPIAKDGKWQPAVRENALLAIGEVKSPKTVPVLLDLIANKELHPMFKVLALADLVHLGERDPLRPKEPTVLDDPQIAAPVVPAMLAFVRLSRPNPSDGLRWVRGQAADVLGEIGSSQGEVPTALLAMVADEELPLIIRGKAACALGKLKYNGNLPDAATYTKNFAQFGSAALADNLPGEARRIWAVCNDFLGGLEPLMTQGAPSKTAHDIHVAMDELRKAASKQKAGGGYPSEEDLKSDIAKARKVVDAAAKIK